MTNPNNTFVEMDLEKIEKQRKSIATYYKEFIRAKMKEYKTLLIKVTRKKYPEDPTNPASRQVRHLKLYAQNGSSSVLAEIALPFVSDDSGENALISVANPYTKKIEMIWHASKTESKIASDKVLCEVYRAEKNIKVNDVSYTKDSIFTAFLSDPIKADLQSEGLITFLGARTTTVKQTVNSINRSFGVMKRDIYLSNTPLPEIISQESLNSGNISHKINDYFTKNKEYMKNAGPDVHNFLTNNPQLSQDKKFRVADAMIKAMMTLHFHGFIHTDIKLENICIREISGELIATLIDCGPSWGTPSYLSPEFFEENKYPGIMAIQELHSSKIISLTMPNFRSLMSYKSDIFSLGIALLFVLKNDLVFYRNGLINKMLKFNVSERTDLLLEPNLCDIRKSLGIPEGISSEETICVQTYAKKYAQDLRITISQINSITACNQSRQRTLYTTNNQITFECSANDPGSHEYAFKCGEAHVKISTPVASILPMIETLPEPEAISIPVQSETANVASSEKRKITDFFKSPSNKKQKLTDYFNASNKAINNENIDNNEVNKLSKITL